MARPARVIVMAVVAALVAAGCFSEGDPPNGGTSNGGLVGAEWQVTSIGGAATIAGAPPTMVFGQDGNVHGTTGCNTYSASFLTDRERIHIVVTAMTAMGCDPARTAQEVAFDAALSAATLWRRAEDASLHMTGAAELVAMPAASNGSVAPFASAALAPAASGPAGSPPVITDLGGTTWSLVELGGTPDLALIVPDIGFGEDGTVSGFAGCNTFTGTYTVDGSALHLGPLATTRIACPRPASGVEANVLAALAGVRTWSIGADGRLVLDGTMRLTYRPG